MSPGQTSSSIPGGDLVKELFALSTMTLATSDLDGQPHAAPVYFAGDEANNLYFFSALHSRHAHDLEKRPAAAGALYPLNGDWRTLQGLQMHGTAVRLVPREQWDLGWQIYLAKFPFVRKLPPVLAQNQLFCFQIEWLRLIDNRRRFGYKKEWHLTG